MSQINPRALHLIFGSLPLIFASIFLIGAERMVFGISADFLRGLLLGIGVAMLLAGFQYYKRPLDNTNANRPIDGRQDAD